MAPVRHQLNAKHSINARPLPRLARCMTVEDVLAGLSEIALEKGIDLTGIKLQHADSAKEIKPSRPRSDIGDVEIKVEVEKTRLVLQFHGPVNDIAAGEIEAAAYIAAQRIELLSFVGRDLQRARKGSLASPVIEGFVGNSELIHKLEQAVLNAANSDLSVLITGESGTGKELIARGIHKRSSREEEPFIAVNCSALPENLIESELFGHEKGAFTGAIGQRKGKFELAHGGTILLDEIGELPLQSQAKILRVLQERVFERVGGTRLIEIDVRVIAATNRDLEAMIKEGGFRQDLYYRLKERRLKTPALRDRSEDIPLLVEHFMNVTQQRRCYRFHVEIKQDAMELFHRYRWPGNVRELESIVKILAEDAGDGGAITLEQAQREIPLEETEMIPSGDIVYTGVLSEDESLIKHVNRMILEIYEVARMRCGGSHAAAARRLKIDRTTLYKLLKRAHTIIANW